MALYLHSFWCKAKLGERQKQKSLCDEVISQNSLLFMEKKPSKGGCMLPEGQPSTEDWFILNNTGVRVSGLLSWLSCAAQQLCSCLVPTACFCLKCFSICRPLSAALASALTHCKIAMVTLQRESVTLLALIQCLRNFSIIPATLCHVSMKCAHAHPKISD